VIGNRRFCHNCCTVKLYLEQVVHTHLHLPAGDITDVPAEVGAR